MPSFGTVDSTKMELTPMKVLFKPPGATVAVDLGGTLGNVVITMAYKKADIMADQLGKTVLTRRVSALDIKVTTELAEIQNKDLWKIIFPPSTLMTETAGPGKAIDFNSQIGLDDQATAGELTLHPLSKLDTDKSTDYNFPKACSTAESEVVYGPDAQAKLKIVWTILPDLSTTPAHFMRYGDKTLA